MTSLPAGQFSLIGLGVGACFLLLKYYAVTLYSRHQRMRVDDKPVYSKLGDAESWETLAYLPAPYVRGEEVVNDSHRMNMCFVAALLLAYVAADGTRDTETASIGVISLLFAVCDCVYTPLALMQNSSLALRRAAFAVSCVATLVLGATLLLAAGIITWEVYGWAPLTSLTWATAILLSSVLGLSLYNRRCWLLSGDAPADSNGTELVTIGQRLLDDDSEEDASAPAASEQAGIFFFGEQVVSEQCHSVVAFFVSTALLLFTVVEDRTGLTLGAITAFSSLFVTFRSLYLCAVLFKRDETGHHWSKVLSGISTFVCIFFTFWGVVGSIATLSSLF